MKRVIIESPFAGDNAVNVMYARACMSDSLERGEAPFASHLLYPQALDDEVREEREMGMNAGFAWGEVAELVAVYEDRGISPGMRAGIKRAEELGIAIEYRKLYVRNA